MDKEEARFLVMLSAVLCTACEIEPKTMSETDAYLGACKCDFGDWERVKGCMIHNQYATFDKFHRIHLTDAGRAKGRHILMVIENNKQKESDRAKP